MTRKQNRALLEILFNKSIMKLSLLEFDRECLAKRLAKSSRRACQFKVFFNQSMFLKRLITVKDVTKFFTKNPIFLYI